MISVKGQLTDQLLEMKDFMSSLLTNVINLVTSHLGDSKKLPRHP
jgi:hypothetical protein